MPLGAFGALVPVAGDSAGALGAEGRAPWRQLGRPGGLRMGSARMEDIGDAHQGRLRAMQRWGDGVGKALPGPTPAPCLRQLESRIYQCAT